jgi:hypothetical protein
MAATAVDWMRSDMAVRLATFEVWVMEPPAFGLNQ